MIPATRWVPAIAVAFAVVFALLVPLQQGIDRALGPYRQVEETLYVPSGQVIKKLSFGYHGLLAAVYWTRAVQYFGKGVIEHRRNFDLLYPLLDITTTLDPQLGVAYRYGAIYLTEKPPGGAGRSDLAIKLVQKGLRENPEYWRFYFDLGFIYYWDLKDYKKASEAFLEGSKNPRAQPWMKIMAAVVLQKGADRSTAYELWRKIYETSEDAAIQQNALTHMAGLRAEEQIEALQPLVRRYQKEFGETPHSFVELVALGWLKSYPRDPFRFPYHISLQGEILPDPESPVYRVLTETEPTLPAKRAATPRS